MGVPDGINSVRDYSSQWVGVVVCRLSVLPFFCLDEISFRRDYKSCRVGVVVRCSLSFVVVPRLWKLCNGITFVILELHFWDLVHCLLISFCFGSEILKKNRTTPTPKKNQKNPKKRHGFSRWDNLSTL